MRLVIYGGTCRVCGCTDDHACATGCSWIKPDLCSLCHEATELLAEWLLSAVKPSVEALLKEVDASLLAESGAIGPELEALLEHYATSRNMEAKHGARPAIAEQDASNRRLDQEAESSL